MSKFSELGNDLYSGKRSFNIVGGRRRWYLITAVLIAISLVGIFGRGLNFGIEFRGGTELRVSTVQDMSNYESRATAVVSELEGSGTTTVTQIGSSTIRIQTGELTNEQGEQGRAALAEEFNVPLEEVASSFVGPSWGETVTNKAIQALVVFLLLVALVLSLYFRTWKMAVAALIALVHDVLFTVGAYALIGIEISSASVVGFLTILGYSIYDTIVVFDKVRENTEHAFDTKRQTYSESANLAVNQTIVRSINTSIVALLPAGSILLVALTLIGPGTLLDLAWALFLGIAVGAYSSIFIATPLLVDLRRGEDEIRKHDATVTKRRARAESKASARTEKDGASTDSGIEIEARLPDDLSPVSAVGESSGAQLSTPRADGERPAPSSERMSAPATGRPLHPYAARGPRNQPKRKRGKN